MGTPIQQLFDLSGRTALVTGGSRGLGLQIAEALGEAGAKVMLTSRKAADLEEAAAHLSARGIDARWIAADAASPDDVHRVCAETLERLPQCRAGDADLFGEFALAGEVAVDGEMPGKDGFEQAALGHFSGFLNGLPIHEYSSICVIARRVLFPTKQSPR